MWCAVRSIYSTCPVITVKRMKFYDFSNFRLINVAVLKNESMNLWFFMYLIFFLSPFKLLTETYTNNTSIIFSDGQNILTRHNRVINRRRKNIYILIRIILEKHRHCVQELNNYYLYFIKHVYNGESVYYISVNLIITAFKVGMIFLTFFISFL